MRFVRFGRLGPALGLAAMAMVSVAPGAAAQDRFKIEVVPQIPHSSLVTSVAFSADGARALSGSEDNAMKLWDAATGALLRTFGHTAHLPNRLAG